MERILPIIAELIAHAPAANGVHALYSASNEDDVAVPGIIEAPMGRRKERSGP